MKTDINPNTPHSSDTLIQGAVDRAAHVANNLLSNAESAVEFTSDAAKDGVKALRERTEHAGAKLGARAGDLAERGMNSARNTAEQVTGTYNKYLEATCCYVAEQPVRAVLISAAIGATIAALALSSRNGHRH
jgi:ElaB/YqjD/DUF883 family membrane-anchored ribosome-binding protein